MGWWAGTVTESRASTDGTATVTWDERLGAEPGTQYTLDHPVTDLTIISQN